MKKKIRNILITLLAFSLTLQSYAAEIINDYETKIDAGIQEVSQEDYEVAEKISEQSEALYLNKKGFICSEAETYEEFIKELDTAVLTTYKGCAYQDSKDSRRILKRNNTFILNTTGIGILKTYQEEIDEWSKSTAKELFTDGMYRDVALFTAFQEICKYTYDSEALFNKDLANEEQGAYSLITTGKGICASMSRAYLCLVESIPFKNNVVDWNTEEPEYLDVKLIIGNKHMLNGVILEDQWIYIDTACHLFETELSDYGYEANNFVIY